MAFASRDGTSIHYERDEVADGETVVFVQGLGYGRWMWRWQREALRGEYDVLAPDTRGTGRSDDGLFALARRLPRRVRAPVLARRGGYTVDGLAADLDAVLDAAGVWNAHLVGASTGGMVALQYALEYDRASSLALVGTSRGGQDAVPVPAECRAHLFGTGGRSGRRERMRHRLRPVFTERFTNRNPHLLDRIVEWSLERDADGPTREALARTLREFDASDRLDRIRVPTLVLHGSDDRVLPVANGRLLAEKIADSRYVELEGGGHLLPVENADRVSEELLAFLDEQA